MKATVMRQFILFLMLSVSFLSASAANDRPEIARYAKAYSGGEGIVVRTLRVGPQANQEAIVQITGIDHKWDGRIQKMKMEPTQRGVKYVTTADGKRYDVLVMDDGGTELYVPGIARKTTIIYDKALSAQTEPEHLLTEYLDQK
jgi:hypothetical protein